MKKRLPRPRSKATLRALRCIKKRVAPTKKQIQAVAVRYGIHWTTLYRALDKVADAT